jgi:glycosyltransferase involved in cell wall biosynthesis
MISVIIPAHNEATVVGRCLQALLAGAGEDELDIVVVCNGCSDDTAEVARRFAPAVRVLETSAPGKTNALNLGDSVARSFPRFYVDADVVIGVEALRTLARQLNNNGFYAVAPVPVIDVSTCSSLVRAYYSVRARLPSAKQGIGGSGVYALSSAGRGRFAAFPDITADDAYVRQQFAPAERATILSVKSTVYAPETLRDLLAIRTRIYYGIAELARRFPETKANADASNRRALLMLFSRPWMWPATATYLLVNTIARCLAYSRTGRRSSTWARDNSSRHQAA